MATEYANIGYLNDPETEEKFYPYTPAEAVIGLENFIESKVGKELKVVYEDGTEVPLENHAGLKEVGGEEAYRIPFSGICNDISTGTSQVQIILNGNFS